MNRMTFATALLVAGLLAVAIPAPAQDPPPPRQGDPDRRERVERVERLKQMRMIEVLGLGEEESVRFMAKRKEHEDRIRELSEERGSLLDGIEDEVGPLPGSHGGKRPHDAETGKAPADAPEAKADLAAVDKNVAKILEQDRKIFDERKRYQDEMRKLLGTEKFAKMLLFERDFMLQVRDAMGRKPGRRGGKFDE